jgi:hypothetical protein
MAFSGGAMSAGSVGHESGIVSPTAAPAWHAELTAAQHERLISPGVSARAASRGTIAEMKGPTAKM